MPSPIAFDKFTNATAVATAMITPTTAYSDISMPASSFQKDLEISMKVFMIPTLLKEKNIGYPYSRRPQSQLGCRVSVRKAGRSASGFDHHLIKCIACASIPSIRVFND
jgi:hypothetical protein